MTVTALIFSATQKMFGYTLVRWCWQFLYTLTFGFCSYTLIHISRIMITRIVCLIISSCVHTWFCSRLPFLSRMCNACIMHFIQSLEITTLTCVGLLQNLKTYMALLVFWPHTAHNQDMASKERQEKPLRCLDQTRPEGCPWVLKTDVYLGIRYVSIYDMIWYLCRPMYCWYSVLPIFRGWWVPSNGTAI